MEVLVTGVFGIFARKQLVYQLLFVNIYTLIEEGRGEVILFFDGLRCRILLVSYWSYVAAWYALGAQSLLLRNGVQAGDRIHVMVPVRILVVVGLFHFNNYNIPSVSL